MIFFFYLVIIESLLNNIVTKEVLHRLLLPYITMILYVVILSFVSGNPIQMGWIEHILAWGAASQMKNDSWNEIKGAITKRQFGIASRLTAFALYLIYNNQV
jgi:hypothetical protein